MCSPATSPCALHLATLRCGTRPTIWTGLRDADLHPTSTSSRRTFTLPMRTGTIRQGPSCAFEFLAVGQLDLGVKLPIMRLFRRYAESLPDSPSPDRSA